MLWKIENFTAYAGLYFIYYRPLKRGRFEIAYITKILPGIHLHKLRFNSRPWKFSALRKITTRIDFRLTVTQYHQKDNYVFNQMVLLYKDLKDQKSYYDTMTALSHPGIVLVYQVHSRIDGSLIGTPEDALSMIRNHLLNARAINNPEIPNNQRRSCIAQKVTDGKFQSWVAFKNRDYRLISATSESEARDEAAKVLKVQ